MIEVPPDVDYDCTTETVFISKAATRHRVTLFNRRTQQRVSVTGEPGAPPDAAYQDALQMLRPSGQEVTP